MVILVILIVGVIGIILVVLIILIVTLCSALIIPVAGVRTLTVFSVRISGSLIVHVFLLLMIVVAG